MVIFKTGDVVRLKSGGPKMTVYRHWDSDQVECNHFVADAMRSVVLPPQMLELIDDPSYGFISDESFDDPPAQQSFYDADVEEANAEYESLYSRGNELSSEELDALMYASEVEQYGPSSS